LENKKKAGEKAHRKWLRMQKKNMYISKKNGGAGIATARPARSTVRHDGRFELDFPLQPVEMPPPEPVKVVDVNGKKVKVKGKGKKKIDYNDSIPIRFPTYLNDPARIAEENKPPPAKGPKALIPIRKGLSKSNPVSPAKANTGKAANAPPKKR